MTAYEYLGKAEPPYKCTVYFDDKAKDLVSWGQLEKLFSADTFKLLIAAIEQDRDDQATLGTLTLCGCSV